MTTGLLILVAAAGLSPIAPQASNAADTRSDLRILFVGHDPAAPYVNYNPTKKMVAMHAERSGAFEAFLSGHFQHVRVVFAQDYGVEMSGDVDVTIFDAKPPTLVEPDRVTKYHAQLLPMDFARPILTIGEVSADVGQGLELKIDWL